MDQGAKRLDRKGHLKCFISDVLGSLNTTRLSVVKLVVVKAQHRCRAVHTDSVRGVTSVSSSGKVSLLSSLLLSDFLGTNEDRTDPFLPHAHPIRSDKFSQ